MQAVKILLVATILSIIPGQLLRIPLMSQSGALTLTDILVFTTNLIFLLYYLPLKKKVKLPQNIFIPATLFILVATLSTILALNKYSVYAIAVSALFLVRFILYFSTSIIAANFIKKTEIKSWVKLIIATITIYLCLGVIQFIIFPDLTILAPFGWDPHQMRIVSTFLDPNFSGALFSILIAFSLTLFLFGSGRIYLFLSIFSFIGIVLTYSRSSYLDLAIVITILGIFKSPKLFITFSIIIILIFSQVGRVRERVIGALTLDETAQARVESWKNAGTIIGENLFFGVGFNTYRFAQADHGFFTPDDPLGGHSGGGTDSSFLLVAATCGLIGLAFFFILIASILKKYFHSVSSNYLHLASISSFLGLIVHTQFVNSLFFPQIMLLVWFILGLNLANDN